MIISNTVLIVVLLLFQSTRGIISVQKSVDFETGPKVFFDLDHFYNSKVDQNFNLACGP